MKLEVEFVENEDQTFWIYSEKTTSKDDRGILPKFASNVASGKTVAVYRYENNQKVQLAQLSCPNYSKLQELYKLGEPIDLSYSYIDDFSWLRDEQPHEVEELDRKDIGIFRAPCSLWNHSNKEDNKTYVHIKQLTIAKGDVDFERACLNEINLEFSVLKIVQGNLKFDYSEFYDSQVTILGVECGGNKLFPSEISFHSIHSYGSNIHIDLLFTKLSIEFLCARIEDGSVFIDGLPYGLDSVGIVNAQIEKIKITNAKINTLDVRDAVIQDFSLVRCIFDGACVIAGEIKKLTIDSGIINNAFKLGLKNIEELGFDQTLSNGRIHVADFRSCINAISTHIKEKEGNEDQFLMLKENFRQTGEYRDEDICHLRYQRLKTKREKKRLKKCGRLLLDAISGYGTKPFRMLLTILVAIVFFGTLYFFVPALKYHGANTWLEYVYTSGITFFAVGYGDLYPLNIITKMVSLIEAFAGVTATSYFLVLLSRKVIR